MTTVSAPVDVGRYGQKGGVKGFHSALRREEHAGLMSYGLSARVLAEVLPLGRPGRQCRSPLRPSRGPAPAAQQLGATAAEEAA